MKEKKTNSQKFWLAIGIIAYLISGYLSIYTLNYTIDANKDIPVSVVITGKYSQGYHTKHSVGEDAYLVCYSNDYGHLAIRVSPSTYFNTEIGEKTVFDLSKVDIDRYANGRIDLVGEWIPFGLILGLAWSLVTIGFLGNKFFSVWLPAFNDYLDKK